MAKRKPKAVKAWALWQIDNNCVYHVYQPWKRRHEITAPWPLGEPHNFRLIRVEIRPITPKRKAGRK